MPQQEPKSDLRENFKRKENYSSNRFMGYISDHNMTVSIVTESICQNGCVDKETFNSQQLL